jgi:hypothetical protein
MSGVPSDLAAVVAVFERYGCPRPLSNQVAEQLRAAGVRLTRVKPEVDLVGLAGDLAALGIKVEIGEF